MLTIFLQSDWFSPNRISRDRPQFDHIWNPIGGNLTLTLLQQPFQGLLILRYFCIIKLDTSAKNYYNCYLDLQFHVFPRKFDVI